MLLRYDATCCTGKGHVAADAMSALPALLMQQKLELPAVLLAPPCALARSVLLHPPALSSGRSSGEYIEHVSGKFNGVLAALDKSSGGGWNFFFDDCLLIAAGTPSDPRIEDELSSIRRCTSASAPCIEMQTL